jgi:hypothetical protein
MTRFDATDPEERRALFVDALAAHDERDSAFLTVEADGEDDEDVPPWIQYADGRLNLDCTDEELDALKALLEEFSAVSIDDLHRPEEAEGTNARLVARTDPDRVAQFLDRAFREVYDLPEEYRAWVAEV